MKGYGKPDITFFKSKLNFKKETIHSEGRKYRGVVERACFFIDNNIFSSECIPLCESIAFYYLFYLKDKEKALKYLNQLNYPLDSFQYPIHLAYIAYANTLDEKYEDDDLWLKALEAFASFQKAEFWESFCKRNLALMAYRKGLNSSDNKRKEFLLAAQKIINEVIQLQELQLACRGASLSILLELAETYHFKGEICNKLNEIRNATDMFYAAAQRWYQFYFDGRQEHHPAMFVTQLSLGKALLQSKEYERAMIHLVDAQYGLLDQNNEIQILIYQANESRQSRQRISLFNSSLQYSVQSITSGSADKISLHRG